jgi:hypothetical protein
MARKAGKKKPRFVAPSDPDNPTLEEFAAMVEAHDPTFVWSRNPADHERGEAEARLIEMARDSLGDTVAVPVWNRALTKKVVPSMMDDFFWSVRRTAANI